MRVSAFFLLFALPVLAGDLTDRFQLTVRRVLEGGPPRFDDRFVLADANAQPGRRFTEFSGDVSGRYIGALAESTRVTGEQYPRLERIVAGALALQRADGHFGAPLSEGKVVDSDMATLWGNGRMLIGLVEYYDLTGQADALAGAKKLGDFLVGIAPRFNSQAVREAYNGEKFAVGYICWTNSLEGLVGLYRISHDQRYLALAREIAARTDRHPAQHSHGFLTTVRGIVDLYKVTGEKSYLEQAETEWKGVLDSGNMLVQGAVPEMFAPQMKRDEGCSEADWLRLSLQLWTVTRKPQYLEQAENTLFNEMAMNQFHNGDFGHHTLLDAGTGAPFAHAWWCCTFHGLRALAAVFPVVFHDEAGSLDYDLPVDGKGEAGGLALSAESSLERDASVQLTVLKAGEGAAELRVRVPEWASEVRLSCGGERVEAPVEQGYVRLKKTWRSGETVKVNYTLKTRMVKRWKKANQAAVFHGPWLLGVDEAGSPNYFDEPAAANKVELAATGGEVSLMRDASASKTTGRFSVPVAHFRLRYLPGGYRLQPQTALLRPVAEYTGGPDENELDFWLPLKGRAEGLDSNYRGQ